MKIRELRPHIPELYDDCEIKILGKDGEVYNIDEISVTCVKNIDGDDYDTVIYLHQNPHISCRFEDTCLAIEKAIDDGEINISEYGVYPDDVDAVQKWIEARAEELHDET